MKKLLIITLVVILMMTMSIAHPNKVLSTNKKSGIEAIIPDNAVQITEHIFNLGTSMDKGKVVEGFAFIHKKKLDGHISKGLKHGGGKCYKFLAKDTKWKTQEDWLVNPSNNDGLSDSFIFNKLESSMQEWEDASIDIFGDGAITSSVLVADTISTDGLNEVYFDSLGSSTIAVTIIWGIFSGKPSERELVEWDMIFNDDFDFGDADLDSSLMDFQNIAMHELGHAIGLGHPNNKCTDETMYAYADFGETKKRDLNYGDIDGIGKLYS